MQVQSYQVQHATEPQAGHAFAARQAKVYISLPLASCLNGQGLPSLIQMVRCDGHEHTKLQDNSCAPTCTVKLHMVTTPGECCGQNMFRTCQLTLRELFMNCCWLATRPVPMSISERRRGRSPSTRAGATAAANLCVNSWVLLHFSCVRACTACPVLR